MRRRNRNRIEPEGAIQEVSYTPVAQPGLRDQNNPPPDEGTSDIGYQRQRPLVTRSMAVQGNAQSITALYPHLTPDQRPGRGFAPLLDFIDTDKQGNPRYSRVAGKHFIDFLKGTGVVEPGQTRRILENYYANWLQPLRTQKGRMYYYQHKESMNNASARYKTRLRLSGYPAVSRSGGALADLRASEARELTAHTATGRTQRALLATVANNPTLSQRVRARLQERQRAIADRYQSLERMKESVNAAKRNQYYGVRYYQGDSLVPAEFQYSGVGGELQVWSPNTPQTREFDPDQLFA